MRGGPWTFDNQLLLLQRWKKGMTVGNIHMESTPFGSKFGMHRLI